MKGKCLGHSFNSLPKIPYGAFANVDEEEITKQPEDFGLSENGVMNRDLGVIKEQPESVSAVPTPKQQEGITFEDDDEDTF